MFVTGLTYQNIIDREPALADFDTSYATSFTGLIAEAKGVIDNRLRALGYDLDKIGRKTYFWNWDNEAGDGSTQNSKTISISGVTNDNLFIILTSTEIDNYTLSGDHNNDFLDEAINSLVIRPARGHILDGLPDSTELTLTVDTALTANSIIAYLTDPAIYFVHLFKSLEIIYESMRSNPGDLFEQKSLYYGDLYEREFQNLVTFYDADGDGVASLGEQISLNSTTLSR